MTLVRRGAPSMKVRGEGASLEVADVEPCRCCQAQTVGISTHGSGAGGLGATGPSAAAARFVASRLLWEKSRPAS
jgi:hypothetical protein